MSMRTPLGRVRGLGSAKEGSDHFWMERLTGVALLLLLPFLIGLIVSLLGANYDTVRSTLRNPVVGTLLLLLIVSAVHHMRIGMQVIIEDYVHTEGIKIACLMLNTFFALLIGATCILAVLKLNFGA
jgi:succinate dehydrogenase / fumarate reductase, membrane anchor subunit